MKEHTVFALVFLLLIIGFISVDSAITGNFLLRTYTIDDEGNQVFTTKNVDGWSNKDGVNNIKSVGTIAVTGGQRPKRDETVLGAVSYFSTTSPFDYNDKSFVFSHSFFTAPNSMYHQLKSNDELFPIGKFSLTTLSICMERAILSGDTSPTLVEVRKIYASNRLTNNCPDPEILDSNGDGYIRYSDWKIMEASARGRDASRGLIRWSGLNPCYFGGGKLSIQKQRVQDEFLYYDNAGGALKCVMLPDSAVQISPYRHFGARGFLVPESELSKYGLV
jgi:hypothetical protein